MHCPSPIADRLFNHQRFGLAQAALEDYAVSGIVVMRSGPIARSVLALGRSTPSLTAMERPFELRAVEGGLVRARSSWVSTETRLRRRATFRNSTARRSPLFYGITARRGCSSDHRHLASGEGDRQTILIDAEG